MVKEKAVITSIVLLIVAIIVIFQFVGSSSNTITDSADSITDANNCSLHTDVAGEKFTYNITDKKCYNSTAGAAGITAKQYDLPLAGLFGSSGVLLLIMMAAILLVIIAIALASIKKK